MIKNHSTKQLKILIFKVNDKVTQINDTLKIIREFLYFSDVTKAISIRDDLIKEDGAYSDSLNLLIKLETELNKISENKTFP